MLLLPSDKENEDDARVLFNVQDRGMYKIKNLGCWKGDWCIGSTGRWLVFLDHEGNVFLLNPFSRAQIQLPPWNEDLIRLLSFRWSHFLICPREHFSGKAILLSEPNTHDVKNLGLAVLCNNCNVGCPVFYKNGKWNFTNPHSQSTKYCDIICHANGVYALTDRNSIEVWDLQGSLPVKKGVFQFSATRKMMKATQDFDGFQFKQSYLVESAGDVLVVTRYKWYVVNPEGKPVDGPEDGVITPYGTPTFLVHRVDFNEKLVVESLEDRILFLGGNYSLSLSSKDALGYERNSIYFTYNHWTQFEEDCSYGGHDLGMFSLQDRTFKQIYRSDTWKWKIDPPPFWIFPTPLKFTPASSDVNSCP